MISQSFIDDLMSRIDLPVLIGEYVELVRKGASHEGCCPFHEEKTPSFKVFHDHYHCFGCGAHGNAAGFITAKLGRAFPEAVQMLAMREGLEVEDDARPRSARSSSHQEALDALSQACADYQHRLFLLPDNPAMTELTRRGIDADLAIRYGLGFAPDQWDTLSGNKAFRSKALIESGLAVSRTEGKGIYDRFRNRVLFPILDHQGRTIGFGGRRLGDDDGPKYLNSPETKLYQKSTVLFGLHQAKTAIRQINHVIVVEGYFDVVTPAQHGVENVVSTCGTAMTEVQAEILLSVADRVTCCFDGDAAGNKATWAAATLLVPRVNDGHEIRLCRLPAGHDPDSLVREHGVQAFAGALEAAPTLVDYLASEIARGARSAEARSRAVHAAITQWRNFAAPAMKLFYRQAICAALDISGNDFNQLAAEGPAVTPGDTSLRHCPFCGGGAKSTAHDTQHVVTCVRCGITTPPAPTFENAHNLWNRRDRIRHAA